MRGVLMLVVVALAIPAVHAATCSYTAYTSCGMFGWSRCTRIRYRSCSHGGWSAWTERSRTGCSKTCGLGHQIVTKVRTCTNPAPSGGGRSCSGSSSISETVSCNIRLCPGEQINGGWSAWNEQSRTACTKSCGTGNQTVTKVRTCTNPAPAHGGRSCVGSSRMQETPSCNTQPCPINGGWTDWTEQFRTACTKSCGTGSQIVTKVRTCTNPSPANNGSFCSGQNSMQETPRCNTQLCPVDGGWTDWAEQSRTACTKSCGTGNLTVTKVRTCTNPAPAHGGTSCSGSSSMQETLSCNTQPCPIDGGWTDYAEQSRTACTKSCGTGNLTVTKVRTCTNPSPAHGGTSCSGSSSMQEILSCNTQPCPINGGWTDYSEQSRTACTKSCGTGNLTVTKVRTCTNPAPAHGGASCPGSSSMQETPSCNTQPCPIDGGWTDWEDWESTSKCTVMCGSGEKNQTRDRSCTNPEPRYGGSACVGEESENRTIECNTDDCGDLCPDRENTFLTDNDDEEYYYHCVQGDNITVSTKAILRKCSEDTVWSPSMKNCVHKTDDSSTTPSPTPSCTDGARRADPVNCTFYLWCVGGSEIQYACAAGTKFDNSIGTCNTASLVSCEPTNGK
ncbi:coadhesin-like isoform X1 [Littorina saxatilis]|uniref:coadhesin-like isoform X1 n=1 Tax=Littorina saxatilis TaxID=31220 RepID=UPI0038B4AFF1